MTEIAIDIHGTPHKVDRLIPDFDNKPSFDFKALAGSTSKRFLVLASSEGNLFDPLDSSDNIHQRDRERGGAFWQLKMCSQECYQQYTAFLRSKNRTPYLLAQRRFRNDF